MSPAITRQPLSASTTNRKWFCDVDASESGAAEPSFIGVFGITEFKDLIEGSMQEDSDFSSAWKSEVNTANRWKLELKIRRAPDADSPTTYDPGQEVLRLAARKTGLQNVVKVRWYEMEPGGPRVEAYEGFAAVSYSPDGGNMEATSTASIVLSGRGEPVEIAHPDEPVV